MIPSLGTYSGIFIGVPLSENGSDDFCKLAGLRVVARLCPAFGDEFFDVLASISRDLILNSFTQSLLIGRNYLSVKM
jgi:hypothetical protein